MRERSRAPHGTRRRSRRRGDAAAGRIAGEGRRTLEQAVLEALAGLDATGAATCPVCASERLTRSGCGDCGSRLS